jgi:hypothetical protein
MRTIDFGCFRGATYAAKHYLIALDFAVKSPPVPSDRLPPCPLLFLQIILEVVVLSSPKSSTKSSFPFYYWIQLPGPKQYC